VSALWKINGTEFADLGLSRLRRELRSLAPDLVTFLADGAAYDSADLSGLALGDAVTITHTVAAVETTWFTGVITQIPREGLADSESLAYEVTGPWYYLEQLVFQQRFPLNAGANPSIAAPSTSRRALAVIGQSFTGARETNVAALTDILDYCIGAGALFSRGTLPTGFNFPYISVIAPLCSEAARACLKWMPDAASRFDYTAGTPVLSVVRRGDAAATTVDLNAPPALITQLSVTPRPDLKVDNVVIQQITVDGNSYFIFAEDKSPAGATGREFGSLVIPLDNNTDPIPAGLAANWRSSLSTLQYQGSITFEAEDPLLTVRPGDVVNLTNGLAAWSAMRAQVTAVSEDVDAGSTRWTFGPAAHLSVQDLVTLLRAARDQVTGYNGPPLVAGRRKVADSGVEAPASSAVPTGQLIGGGLTVLGSTLLVGDVVTNGSLEVGADLFVGGFDVAATLDDLGADLALVVSDVAAHEERLDYNDVLWISQETVNVEIYDNTAILEGRLDAHLVRLDDYLARIIALEDFQASTSELSLDYCGGTATFLVV